MREFIYFSEKAVTTGNFDLDNLKDAGRLDIVCNAIIHSFFISNQLRKDVKLHLVFYGKPNPPRHIILQFNEKTPTSKKNLGGLLKRILFKGSNLKNEKVRAFPGCYIEKKSLLNVIKELKQEGKEIFVLDKSGKDLRSMKNEKLANSVFLLGDHEGLPKKEFQRLRKNEKLLSIGNKTYFSSQTINILNHEIDRREEREWKKRIENEKSS